MIQELFKSSAIKEERNLIRAEMKRIVKCWKFHFNLLQLERASVISKVLLAKIIVVANYVLCYLK